MKTFEIWNSNSNGYESTKAAHIVQAASLVSRDGVFLFSDTNSNIVHAIVQLPGMLVKMT